MHAPQPRQDYRIFVGAFPKEPLAGRIQALRQHYDVKTARITPPHVTVAGTYWRQGPATAQNEAAAIAALRLAQARIPRFDLILNGVAVFPGTRPVIHLKVAAGPGLLAARQSLLEVLGVDSHREFVPHLTLAMRLEGDPARAMLAELRSSEWNANQEIAPIEELRLMQRGPEDPAWRCIAVFPLASGTTI